MATLPPVGAQDMPLLRTKLYIPPPRQQQVPRPRLIERLDAAGLRRKLTLVSAPAGFGKTTLVSEWIADCGQRVAWLSLDESDNDLNRFLAYFVAALQVAVQTMEPNIGKGALSALASPQPPPTEAILTSLVNEIASFPDRIVLVLDDYHLIEAQPIHDALTFLLQHLPPQIHLVIATREDPPLPLARLRVRGQLTELRATDLRFTSTEAAEFLNQVMGLNLSAEDIAALETRTEGWIAGLQLAALALQGTLSTQGSLGHKVSAVTGFIQSFTGSHHFVLDYLVEEVLAQQPESVQTFLLQTAVLDRLTGSLCDAVRFGKAESGSQAILERLEHANLFIVPLDEERRWYRYHHLFADLLRLRLRQVQPEQVATLHHRTSEWYEQNGYVDEAIEHALRAEDFERATPLIEENVDAIWQRGEHTRLRRWLAELPVEWVFSSPHLCVIHAWNLFTSGQHDAAEGSLQAAEQALAARTDRAPKTDSMQIRGRVAALRAFLASYSGDVPGTIQYARQALESLPEQDANWRSTATIALGDAYSFAGELAAAHQARLEALEASKAGDHIYMIASLKLADINRQQGQLGRAIEICQQQWQLAQESGMSQTVAVGWLLAIWGEALAERNDLDQALDRAKNGVKRTERGQDAMVIGWSNLCLTRVLFSRGEMAAAQEIILKMKNVARKYDIPPFITNPMAAWQARIWLAQGKLEAVSQWAEERGLDAEKGPTLLREIEYLVLARILIAQGRLDETGRLLQRMLETAKAGKQTSRAIEILNLQALAYQAGGEPARAMTTLEQALVLAERNGFICVFVDEGPPMAGLLYKAIARGNAPDYARRLLAAFPVAELEHAPPSKSQAPQSERVEPLSERELELLQLVAEGLTNQEIASRLYLSLNTVKAHTRNIYGKLGAHSRMQAVAQARALGILPSL